MGGATRPYFNMKVYPINLHHVSSLQDLDNIVFDSECCDILMVAIDGDRPRYIERHEINKRLGASQLTKAIDVTEYTSIGITHLSSYKIAQKISGVLHYWHSASCISQNMDAIFSYGGVEFGWDEVSLIENAVVLANKGL